MNPANEYPLTWFDRFLCRKIAGCERVGSENMEALRMASVSPRLVYDDAEKLRIDNVTECYAGDILLPWDRVVVGDRDMAMSIVLGDSGPPGFVAFNMGDHVDPLGGYLRVMGRNEERRYMFAVAEVSGVPELVRDDLRREMVHNACAMLGWAEHIAHGFVHVAEIVGKRLRVRERTCRLKPWLVRPPHFVAIDFSTAPERHGMPSGLTVGERHRPTPHSRRGHFATLRSEVFGGNRGKRVWRRPAWVGPKEWEYSGQIYRVVT